MVTRVAAPSADELHVILFARPPMKFVVERGDVTVMELPGEENERALGEKTLNIQLTIKGEKD
jgi:hypothetical protein